MEVNAKLSFIRITPRKVGLIADEVRGKGINDVYATAVYTTILAMPYHYLPLYQR